MESVPKFTPEMLAEKQRQVEERKKLVRINNNYVLQYSTCEKDLKNLIYLIKYCHIHVYTTANISL